MKINIKATNIELTPSISQYVEKKVGMVEKYVNNPDAVAQVEVGKITHHHKQGEVFRAEIHLTGSGLDIYAASEVEDLYAAIDLVKDDVVRKIEHAKGKKETLTRRGAQAVKNVLKGLPFFGKD